MKRCLLNAAIFPLLCAVGLFALYRASWTPPAAGPTEGSASPLEPRVLAPALEFEQREVRIEEQQ